MAGQSIHQHRAAEDRIHFARSPRGAHEQLPARLRDEHLGGLDIPGAEPRVHDDVHCAGHGLHVRPAIGIAADPGEPGGVERPVELGAASLLELGEVRSGDDRVIQAVDL